jgi:hypothetical protein
VLPPPRPAAARQAAGAGDRPRTATTFRPFEIHPEIVALDRDAFVRRIFDIATAFRNERIAFYLRRCRGDGFWTTTGRRLVAVMMAVASLLTGLAALAGLLEQGGSVPTSWDLRLFVGAAILYAAVAALSLYEKSTDRSEAYFRALSAITSIRDRWNAYAFDVLEVLLDGSAAATGDALKLRLVALTEKMCLDVDGIATEEMTAWRTAFVKTRSDVAATLEAEGARVRAAIGEASPSPAALGHINLQIAGRFEAADVFVDAVAAGSADANGNVVLRNLRPGPHTIRVEARRDGAVVPVEEVREVRKGVETVRIAIPDAKTPAPGTPEPQPAAGAGANGQTQTP